MKIKVFFFYLVYLGMKILSMKLFLFPIKCLFPEQHNAPLKLRYSYL